MAKGSDNLAGSFDSENTGGLLSGLLAEEEALDRRALWRLGSWGVAAVGAVIVGILANQSSIGWRHEQLAAADLTRQSQQIQAVVKESQNETRRLSSAIDTLNGDRDRLYSRVTVLEQGLDTVTGTIARQKSTTASPPGAPAATPVAAATPPMSAAAAVQAATQSPNPPPFIGPVATIAASSAEKPQMEASLPAVSPTTVASVAPQTANTPAATTPATTPAASTPAAGATPAAAATPVASSATPSTPLMESKSMMAPPDAAAGKLIEPEASKYEAPTNADAATPAPEVVASNPPAAGAEPDSTQAIPQPEVQRTEFAVDVGGANSVGGLRALWRGLLKSRSNAPLATLQPIIVVKESNTGLGMQLRLVAGPLGDAAAAARICATMIENKRPCETTVFDGQHLAMKAGDEPSAAATATGKLAPNKPAAAKPASIRPAWHRHSYPKRSMTEEPAKKPDPPSTLSTLSSYFGSGKNAK